MTVRANRSRLDKDNMKGKLIVIEGLDGSGKGTQTKQLYETLLAAGKQVRQISFPCYGTKAAALLESYLKGEFGNDPSAVNPYAASTFFAIDRYVSFQQEWKEFYENGGIVIADRYTTSNAIHQCAKLPKEQWDSFLDWLFTYEYRQLGLPTPDAVIYLRVDPEISQELLIGRYEGNAAKKDIHESNLGYLKNCRRAADYCAGYLNWCAVECVRDEQLRSIEDIAAEVLQIAER